MSTPTINPVIDPVIDQARLLRELHHLATLTDCPPSDQPNTTAVTRIVFTTRDLEARHYILSLAHAAGFQTRIDPIGNTFLRFPGTHPTLPAVATGSHADAIPHAGMYDGTVGVLGGLEAMRSLKESGFTPRRSIETILFTSEEPTRFGIGCLGSRLLGGVLSPSTADALPDRLSDTDPQAPTGLTLHAVRTAAGFTGDLATVPLPPNYFHAWLELHIEQGPLLERAMQDAQRPNHSLPTTNHPPQSTAETNQKPEGPPDTLVPQGFSLGSHSAEIREGVSTPEGTLVPQGFSLGSPSAKIREGVSTPEGTLVPQGFSLGSPNAEIREGVSTPDETILGIVTAIAAPASYRYTLEGIGGHAGALLMPDRRDALCAAAELILSVERHTLAANAASHSADSVATIGTVAVHPGAVNSVPSRVTLNLDIRDTDVTRRDRTMAALHADIAEIQTRRGVTITEEQINADLPAASDTHVLDTLRAVCAEQSVPYREIVSRAYHDTSFIARIAPVAMLFIPCRNGVSHRPDEYATPKSIALGVRILALTLAHLASE